MFDDRSYSTSQQSTNSVERRKSFPSSRKGPQKVEHMRCPQMVNLGQDHKRSSICDARKWPILAKISYLRVSCMLEPDKMLVPTKTPTVSTLRDGYDQPESEVFMMRDRMCSSGTDCIVRRVFLLRCELSILEHARPAKNSHI